MKRHWLDAASAAAALLLAASVAGAAPQLRVQVDQKGDFVLLGNTLGHECAAGTPAPVVGTVGNCGSNLTDSAADVFWRSDSPANGQAQANTSISSAQARSTAVLALPPGATVTHAFLYWGAAFIPGGDATATLERPGVFSQSITAGTIHVSANDSYQSVADVTAIVQANGPGAYRVSGVSAANIVDQANDNTFAGWWMAVFYSLPTDPPRNLALFDGLDLVANGLPQNAVLAGFLVPPVFGTAKLGVVTFEGDNAIQGDQFFFDGTQLFNAQNPANNFFNGTRSALGVPVSVAGDLPQLTGTAQSMSGMDMDVVDVTSTLVPGQTAAPIQANSTGDVYYLAGFATSIPTFKPDFTTSVKTAVDVNGPPLLAGDVMEYTIVVTNTGNDTAVNTVLTDPLPPEVTYVPNTLQITAGANSGAKTDIAGDDQCEFVAAVSTVVCRLGTGANAVQGGQMPILGTTTVELQVTVNPGVSGTISNQAVVTAGGLQGAPPEDTPTDGNGPASGQPPTEVIAEECLNDTHCAAPTPYCDVVANPNVCVECLLDVHCPGNLPTCDPATDTCVCVPTGAEICDGKDNDCNGMVDEGFDVGSTCTAGLGECAATGTIACDAMGGAFCTAVPGLPLLEVCDDKDNDCDGMVDDGNPGGGMPCTTGFVGVCSPGNTSCQPGGMLQCLPIVAPGAQAELCNGEDDDCDGSTDEGFPLGDPCTNGLGVCQAAGVIVCDGVGGTVCNGIAGEPSAEICGDDLDTDCDGDDDNGCTDTDGDGLLDEVEEQIGTDPNDADSDDDGLLDGEEPSPGEDTDGDGLIDALDPDSDDDGLFDGTEMGKDCSHPDTEPGSTDCIPDADMGATTTDPLDADTDDGGVSDGAEDANLNGAIDPGEGDPNDPVDDTDLLDTDGDGLSDATETEIGTDPKDADTDNDGVLDGAEVNPTSDTDGDGLINALDPDSDDDGLFDGTELGNDCSHPATDPTDGNCVPDGDAGATTTSPVDPDTDDGGVSDGAEDANGNGVIDPGETDPNDGSDDIEVIDTDGDGLSDGQEEQIGTDPNDADSDDDGLIDGEEANPTDDTDGDGKINALDADSDGDGLFDGTEMGKDCSHPDTDAAAGNCVPDGDDGKTTTSPVDADTDDGGVSDGDEDKNKNGVIDPGETDPNEGSDDNPGQCQEDSHCGPPDSGMVCDPTTNTCIEGCRSGGNGCPEGQVCLAIGDAIGECVEDTGNPSISEAGSCACSTPQSSSDLPEGLWLLAIAAASIGRRWRRRSH